MELGTDVELDVFAIDVEELLDDASLSALATSVPTQRRRSANVKNVEMVMTVFEFFIVGYLSSREKWESGWSDREDPH